MTALLVVVIPVFLLIAAGYAATRFAGFSQAHVDGLMTFTQSFAIPVLLFQAVATLDLGAVFDPRLLISFYGAAAVSFGLGILGARAIFKRRPGEAVVIGFGALFSNSVLIGLPVVERAFGAAALEPTFAIIAIHAPVCYALGITAMEVARSDGTGLAGSVVAIGRALGSNPLMIGIAAGFAVNLTGLVLPEPVAAAAEMLADAALPAALFGLGGVLARYAIRASLGEAGMVAGLSLVVHPALAYALTVWVFDLPAPFVQAAVLTAAMAPGVNTYVFASMYKRAEGAAASWVLLSTAACVLTASVWIGVLGRL